MKNNILIILYAILSLTFLGYFNNIDITNEEEQTISISTEEEFVETKEMDLDLNTNLNYDSIVEEYVLQVSKMPQDNVVVSVSINEKIISKELLKHKKIPVNKSLNINYALNYRDNFIKPYFEKINNIDKVYDIYNNLVTNSTIVNKLAGCNIPLSIMPRAPDFNTS